METSEVRTPYTTWIQTFPHWEKISDFVPVSGQSEVSSCTPENRTEIVLEAATAFSRIQQSNLRQLYPLVPSSFFEELKKEHTPSPLDLHRTLCLVSTAVAATGIDLLPEEDLSRRVVSSLFLLSPEEFYLVVDVQLRARDRRFAEPYYFDNFGNELEIALPEALNYAARLIYSKALKRLLKMLVKFPSEWRNIQPELLEKHGLIEFSLADLIRELYPEYGIRWDLVEASKPPSLNCPYRRPRS